MATNNLTLRPFSIVKEIIYDKETKKAKGVGVLNAETNQATEYFSKIIFLCASTFNSAWILMNSATDIWPDGLGSSSGELGHNVMDHHFRCGASGNVKAMMINIIMEEGLMAFIFQGSEIYLAIKEIISVALVTRAEQAAVNGAEKLQN